jgi:hypothetical protein
MAEWSLDLSKYAEKQKVEIKEVRRAFAFALYSSIVEKTPVDTGRARGNWNISVGSPDESTSNSTGAKFSSPKSLPEPNGDESIFITNNLPYITKLEYGGYPDPPKKDGGKTAGGFSKQAPNGMVGVTLANSANIFDAAARTVTKG